MPIHKLADGPITLTIVGAEQVQGNFGPQVRFNGEDGTDVYVNEVPAQKQLARLNLTLDSVLGSTLYFEQVKKNGTTFTNISMAGAGASIAPRPAAAPAAVAAPKQTIAELAVIYSECVTHAMVSLGAKCEEAGIPVDASAIQSAAATLFIKATR